MTTSASTASSGRGAERPHNVELLRQAVGAIITLGWWLRAHDAGATDVDDDPADEIITRYILPAVQ